MDDDPTQPATQQVLDPRRLGRDNSGLDDDDTADVLLILHPASPSAIRIVRATADTRPEHVLLHGSFNSFSDESVDIGEQETFVIGEHEGKPGPDSRSGADLALRMSTAKRLKFPSLGFVFGRNSSFSDIVFPQDSGKRISNQHFRIYMNVDAVLMLEDMSTNGTIVDSTLLRHKDERFPNYRMLTSGSVILIQSNNDEEMIKFIVRLPSRVSHVPQFQNNVRDFLVECANNEEKEKVLQRLGKQYGKPTMKWDGGEHYNLIGQLGKGAFATVHQLATKMEGKLLAAKELEKRRFMKNGQLDKKIDNEMKIMQSLRHKNIVEFVEYHDQGDYLYIIMEYVRYGDLQGHLNHIGNMPERLVKTMSQQILSALSYLHQLKITHRDIKPDNILIADTEPLTVKLSDFGLSKVVKHDETFLKTFCGTLLYCAPEVFPDFNNTPVKGTKRRRGAKQQFNSYSSSVDIWSFAAVIWYALCGEPPFTGVADATGKGMYDNIMSTELDTTPLETLGVSVECIDLLRWMLQTDPAKRATDWDCLSHPWVNNGTTIPADPTLQSIVEEDESEEAEQKLSQLSIRYESDSEGEDGNVLSDDEFGRLLGSTQGKRIRIDPLVPRNQICDHEHDSSAGASFESERLIARDLIDSFQFVQKPPRTGRLFGEIGPSGLNSSGVLTAHPTEALSRDVSDGGATRPELASTPDRSASQGRHDVHSQLHGSFSSPSLYGAESLVRDIDINMESPVSGAHSPNEPTTPRTPEVVQHNSLEKSSTHPSQISEATPKAKPPTLNRQITLHKTPSFYYDPYDPDTHNLEYASKVSGFDFVGAASGSSASVDQLDDTIRVSAVEESASSTEHEPAFLPSLPRELDIKPPPRRLGKLTATPDSFAPNLVVHIDQNRVTWGRNPTNTAVYENSRDVRVPKTAFVIFWYSSNQDNRENVREMSQQGKDWTTLSQLHVGIWTLATSGISVNGKHLRKTDAKGRALFGHLHSGDIIQVYHDQRTNECLKFKCDFYLGSGRVARPAIEAFKVLLGSQLPE
ncbi:hypothetical protein BDV95DRAFT_603601 [Massariosphaeria phaeospora]|uniref:Kinase-like domain-containing protein n=1 Tax=Massariosphaeria phaeospora TaxID=100035 RepID=A0A7C8IK48_9PLEO|nr:hypothetical protein BDV95DRAFT_603601 [Massariosphaeria phaeospora]